MQVFQWNDGSLLCGIDEVIELFRAAVDKPKALFISALCDSDIISRGEPVMHITGPYIYFANLESLYLGILARRTSVFVSEGGFIIG